MKQEVKTMVGMVLSSRHWCWAQHWATLLILICGVEWTTQLFPTQYLNIHSHDLGQS